MADDVTASRTGRDSQARFDIGALEQRVYGVEKAVTDISAGIAALSTKIDERARTPWATLIAGAVFLLAFMTSVGVLAYKPIESDIARHQQRLNAIDARYVEDMRRTIDRLRRLIPTAGPT